MKSQDGTAEWRLSYVRAEDVDGAWNAVAPFLAQGIQRGVESDLTLEGIKDAAREGWMRLWVVQGERIVSAFAVAEYRDGTAEFLSFAGDRFMDWMPTVLTEFERLARWAGVKRLRIDGRKGWKRTMDKFGFEVVREDGRRVIMERAL